MYPENDPHSSSKGNSTGAPTTEEGRHPEEAVKDADVLARTTNSSTMTCPECQQYPPWPPAHLHHHHPYPYPCPYNGGPAFCYPPYYFGPPPPMAAYNCPYQNSAPHPPYCNNVNVTTSGMSVGGPNRDANTSSEHMLPPNQNLYQPFPTYPAFYNPNHLLLQSQFGGLPMLVGQVLAAPNRNADGVRSRNSLCSNCSTEIISAPDEAEEMTNYAATPLNVTSFTDSAGRTWKCTGTKQKRTATVASRGRETTERDRAANTSTRYLPNRLRMESPSTAREDSGILPMRKKRTKLRSVRKTAAAEELTVSTRLTRCQIAQKPTRKTTDLVSLDRPKAVGKPPRTESPSKDIKKSDGNESPPHEKKPAQADGPSDSRMDPNECPAVAPDADTTTKHAKIEPDTNVDEDRALCVDFSKACAIGKERCAAQESKDEDFWSSSSSSGTYDDSEAFDSFKLLSEAGVDTEAIKQSRQRSRDRLFRRRAGASKVSGAQSDDGLKKSSPGLKVKEQQVIVDTSQVRITEETPKRFIVESKDGASTSSQPKSMTITVQAELPQRTEGGCTDVRCTCDAPPCQRSQWGAPPCPTNETHSTPVHHCHDGNRNLPQTHFPRHRHPNSVGENPHEATDEYRRSPRRGNTSNFGLVAAWNHHRNADRPREENRHPHYVPPRPSAERLDGGAPSRRNGEPTNRTRRWHAQADTPLSNRQAEEMLRIQLPDSFPRYRPYEYGRNHGEEPADAPEENGENRTRNTIDINIFRSGGVRRLGTVRRVVRCNSPRARSHGAEEAPTLPTEEDSESNLDFYRRPRSAITVSKTNYFSPRNRKLEEEVQRIQSANYGLDGPGTSAAKEEESSDYPSKNDDDEQEFEEGEKPDCEYEEEVEEVEDECKREPDRHRGGMEE